MKKTKKQLWLRLAVIVLGIILAHELILYWKTSRVEQELADVNNFAQCYSCAQISYTKKRGIFSNTFEFSKQLSYVVVPFWHSYFFKGLVSFDTTEYRAFPEDLLKTHIVYGTYVHPKSDVVEKKISEPNGTYYLSFDRPYSISEVMGQESLVKASWFWVDTYRNNTDYAESYVRNIWKSNTAYGITSNLKELAMEAENWISMLNQYNDSVRTKIGKRIMDVKHGISNQEIINIDDVQIIGCEIDLSEEELKEAYNNPMFRVID